ncbi:MAG TPA: SDR family oxidoreductase [Rectinemataceae bacterium]
MRVLFTGGTGNLSTACTAEALRRGIEVYHINRGSKAAETPRGVKTLRADIRDEAAVRAALGGLEFDAVVQFLAFKPEQVETDLRIFAGRTRQYVFISTASAYKKPSLTPVITEETPLENPFWEYSRLKAACESLLREKAGPAGLPYTIVRPSHTYDDGWIPGCFGSAGYGLAWRMKEGKPIVVPGDGQSIWTLTHSTDFAVGLAGLLGSSAALGEVFHITSDEHLTWDAIHRIIGAALGLEPKLVHVPSDYIASLLPERGAGLLGDKAVSVIFDNAKIRRFVPEFKPRVSFEEGIRRSLAWFDAHPEQKRPNEAMDQEMDEILGRWNRA